MEESIVVVAYWREGAIFGMAARSAPSCGSCATPLLDEFVILCCSSVLIDVYVYGM